MPREMKVLGTLAAPARHRRFCRALQFVLGALDLAKHMMIARIDPLLAARHTFVAGGEHLTRVLFPDLESIAFFFERERTILNQFVGRRMMRLRMFNLSIFDDAARGMAASLRHSPTRKIETTDTTIGFRSAVHRMRHGRASTRLCRLISCHGFWESNHGRSPWRRGSLIRASIRPRVWRRRRLPKNSPMWQRSTPTENRLTALPWSMSIRTPLRIRTSSARLP